MKNMSQQSCLNIYEDDCTLLNTVLQILYTILDYCIYKFYATKT